MRNLHKKYRFTIMSIVHIAIPKLMEYGFTQHRAQTTGMWIVPLHSIQTFEMWIKDQMFPQFVCSQFSPAILVCSLENGMCCVVFHCHMFISVSFRRPHLTSASENCHSHYCRGWWTSCKLFLKSTFTRNRMHEILSLTLFPLTTNTQFPRLNYSAWVSL